MNWIALIAGILGGMLFLSLLWILTREPAGEYTHERIGGR